MILFTEDLEDKFSKILGSQVAIKNKKIIIRVKLKFEYYSQAELERIYEMLKNTGNKVCFAKQGG